MKTPSLILIALGLTLVTGATIAIWQIQSPSPVASPGTNKNPSPTSPDTHSPSNPKPPSNPIPDPPPTQVLPEITRGNTAKQQVIFTFDCGSTIQSAEAILHTLEQYNVTTTFFVTGECAATYPELIKKMAQEGHEIFNHTYSHPDLTTLSDTQIRDEFHRTEEIMHSLIGATTKPYFRPPFGARNSHILTVAAQEGYRSVYWTTDSLDWKEDLSPEEIKDRVLQNVTPGAIYLMHVGSHATGDILEELFVEITARGYDIVPLTEGLQ